jgi:hypothetical protein
MDGLDAATSAAFDPDLYVSHADPADPAKFQRILDETSRAAPAGHQPDNSAGQPDAPAAGFVKTDAGPPPVRPPVELPPASGVAAPGAAGGAAAWLARNGARAAGAAGTAAAILLTPTNTQRTTETDPVDGHPELGARITRAPGDLSGQATIFARGAAGQPDRDLTTLPMDPQGRLTAPGGDGAELGRRGQSGSVTLSPGVAQALDAKAGVPPPASPGGAGAKLPPGATGVRPDGECDEDGNVGDTSPRTRLPTNGTWTGEPGNSGWLSNNAAVEAETKGQPIQFRDGRPDFTPWAKLSINFQPGELTGDPLADRKLTVSALDASKNPDVQEAGSGRDFLDKHSLTPHHATDTCMQLIPKILNQKVVHIGGAADIRYQNGTGTSQ